jgi:hypothetical protein
MGQHQHHRGRQGNDAAKHRQGTEAIDKPAGERRAHERKQPAGDEYGRELLLGHAHVGHEGGADERDHGKCTHHEQRDQGEAAAMSGDREGIDELGQGVPLRAVHMRGQGRQ